VEVVGGENGKQDAYPLMQRIDCLIALIVLSGRQGSLRSRPQMVKHGHGREVYPDVKHSQMAAQPKENLSSLTLVVDFLGF